MHRVHSRPASGVEAQLASVAPVACPRQRKSTPPDSPSSSFVQPVLGTFRAALSQLGGTGGGRGNLRRTVREQLVCPTRSWYFPAAHAWNRWRKRSSPPDSPSSPFVQPDLGTFPPRRAAAGGTGGGREVPRRTVRGAVCPTRSWCFPAAHAAAGGTGGGRSSPPDGPSSSFVQPILVLSRRAASQLAERMEEVPRRTVRAARLSNPILVLSRRARLQLAEPVEKKVPRRTVKQLVCPTRSWYFPAAHASQLAEPVEEEVPRRTVRSSRLSNPILVLSRRARFAAGGTGGGREVPRRTVRASSFVQPILYFPAAHAAAGGTGGGREFPAGQSDSSFVQPVLGTFPPRTLRSWRNRWRKKAPPGRHRNEWVPALEYSPARQCEHFVAFPPADVSPSAQSTHKPFPPFAVASHFLPASQYSIAAGAWSLGQGISATSPRSALRASVETRRGVFVPR